MVAPKGALTGSAPPGVGDGRPCLTLRVVRPSALREVELRVPRVSWDDIGGQRALNTALIEAVQWPLRHPEAFERLGDPTSPRRAALRPTGLLEDPQGQGAGE
jgi:SpoVK/Ycf46/Vps4 family AAA+-type ATPase